MQIKQWCSDFKTPRLVFNLHGVGMQLPLLHNSGSETF